MQDASLFRIGILQETSSQRSDDLVEMNNMSIDDVSTSSIGKLKRKFSDDIALGVGEAQMLVTERSSG